MILSEKICVNFRRDGRKNENEKKDFFEGKVTRKTEGKITILSVDLHLVQFPHVYARIIDEQKGVWIDIALEGQIDGLLARQQYNPFWSMPCFEKDLSKIPDNIQNMLLKINGEYIVILPIINDDFNVTLMGSEEKGTLRFCLSKYYDGAIDLNGTFAVLAAAENPYDAVKKAYQYASENKLIKTHLRTEKSLDPMYQGLGWCTWNAFYRDVDERSIFKKLDEFQQKKIPIKWVVIDDGWMQYSDDERIALKSFQEDRKKFPNGLKSCIEKMKREYGVEQVGVWHALTGYWFGIAKDSELYYAQKDRLTETNSGLFLPDGEKAYDFFCDWYKYLKEQGIDFVKIDGQGNSLEFYSGKKDCISICRSLQIAADQAVHDCFEGNVINCMAMNNINVHHRPYTSLSRNSDDFYPQNPESFITHIMQNAYNAVFHSQLFYCDYDMWQSYDVTAKISSVLRAISGGPIYLSDEVGKTCDTYIAPFLDKDGNVILCDDCALPAIENLFEDSKTGILRLCNKKGNGYVMAVFNLTHEKKSTTIYSEGWEGEYVAYGFFGKKFYSVLPLTLEIDGFDAEILNFYPVEDGKIHVGDLNKYISVDGRNEICVSALS
ncbi:Sip1-related alpha-galactosidase [Ructibacterium gallinarum]|uniref:Alpha-galactosidase n=1 Tax=Ructibacterium gallinarum TaxID=2779355 RepID=A0A9D5R8F8_9FIRM|nr:Sip1-related alpha-galactosidase [Ructibacterium gallinarum]MBE5039399.1 alpha-galactosidase [Ructibacterium gallinarum]